MVEEAPPIFFEPDIDEVVVATAALLLLLLRGDDEMTRSASTGPDGVVGVAG